MVSALGFGANAQIFSETFDTEIPSTWTIHDVDNLTSTSSQSAYASWAWNSGAQDASSSSWYNNSGLGPTNDWLITPGIAIPATGTFQLEFDGSSHEANYLEEYEVLYSTTGTAVADFTAPALIDVVNEAEAGTFRTVVLPAATAGQTVYIAFHHTSNDESMLHIDNVVVRELLPDDIQMVSLSMANTVAAGNVNITGTVKNNGANVINSFTLTYDAGAGPVSQTVTQTLASGATYNFTHSTPLAATVAGSPYSINVCATIAGDGDVANNCLTHNLGVVSSLVDKYVLIEEKTGTWCQFCPYGSAAMYNVSAAESKMIGVAIHNNDPMAFSSYDTGSNSFPDFTGYPYAAGDRVIGQHAASIQATFNARENEVAPASISFDAAAEAGGVITVTPSVNMVTTLTGNYRVGVILVEDHVTGSGSGWNQVNALSGGGTSVPHGSEDWNLLPNPTDVSAVFGGYDHVARALGDNQINGAAGSLPGTLTDGQSYTHTYTFNWDASWDLNNMHAVAFLVNVTTGEVLNAGSTALGTSSIDEATLDFGVNVAPNPTAGNAVLTVELKEAARVSVQIVDVVGNIVAMHAGADLAAGEFAYPVDLSNRSAGIYFAKINVDGNVKTVKINVAK